MVLPAPPMAMQRIIRTASRGDVSLRQLATLVSSEPSFTVELLRLANSPYYGVRKEVRTPQQATVSLGVRVVRNHAVSHVVRLLSSKLDLEGFDGDTFWEDSLRRAVIAGELAEAMGLEVPQEAFTVGLIQDVGVLVLAARDPKLRPALKEVRTKPASERLALERRLGGATHAALLGSLTAEWGIPTVLSEAVREHHHDSLESLSPLGRIAAVADAAADIYQTGGHPHAVDLATRLIQELGTPMTLEDIGRAVVRKMPEIAREFRIHISHPEPLDRLMAEANRSLVEITHDYEQLTQQLEKLLQEKEELTRMLERANDELRRLAATDELTGVANRRRFMAVATETLERAWRGRRPLSLLLFDLDHFKRVNDTHGHQSGDDVLRGVCRRLGGLLRETDLIGRVGGEEFAILLPGTDENGGRIVGERCRALVASRPFPTRTGARVALTTSFGGVTVHFDQPRLSLAEVYSQADAALYQSKTSGRDRVTWSE